MITLLGFLKVLGGTLIPFLIGLLFPSPLQKAIDGTAKNHEDEAKATNSGGNVTPLDHLP